MLVSQGVDAAFAGVAGLLVGSFLNVVIHRLPKMLERDWWHETLKYLLPDEQIHQTVFGRPRSPELSAETTRLAGELAQAPPLSLWQPRSRCPACAHAIRWYENVPVLSWLFLRGKCSACGTQIGWRYPLVEITTSALFAFCAWRWGLGWPAAAWCFFCAVLLCAAVIDWDTTYLPDELTQALVWTGILASTIGWLPVRLDQSVMGAAAGYGSLWLVNFLFCLVTRRDEAMASGDFKLFAALGAWFGWPALVPMILMASVIGSVVGIALKLRSSLREGGFIPFGPFLAGAGITALVFGPQAILRVVGL